MKKQIQVATKVLPWVIMCIICTFFVIDRFNKFKANITQQGFLIAIKQIGDVVQKEGKVSLPIEVNGKQEMVVLELAPKK